ncbi:MAG: SDR family NAD(P)-dependent oxidoreductase [Syntrophobacterales bacterium]|jgi:FlaA1/EpsC-like NDP-sugar epimerase|nr:SDR family NAD(P)-dependent oxidoreductase [Syntrophobacterales bacterium]
MKEYFSDKTILITGAAGTIGRELVRQLLEYNPATIRLLDNNETELYLLGEKYSKREVTPFLGDVRDQRKLLNLGSGVDIVFHTAAFKHVSLSEYNPFDAVQTNIIGVQNVIQMALENRIPRVIFTSSDKAVNPTNVMGTTKLMGERLMTAANIVNYNGRQIFSSVRFGNVIGSRGSVVPIFASQIGKGGPVTITDKRMTRFVMTIPEAAHLVLKAGTLACGGEVLITKMPVMRIVDLAQAMVDLLAPAAGLEARQISLKMIGAGPGEKMYEELMSSEEVQRAQELPSMYVILPALSALYGKIQYGYPEMLPAPKDINPYNSSNETPMTLEEIKRYLLDSGALQEYLENAPDNYSIRNCRIVRAKGNGLKPNTLQ